MDRKPPKVTLDDMRLLLQAPRSRPILPGRGAPGASGTRVTTRAFDVLGAKWPWVKAMPYYDVLEPVLPDHQYTEFDDGRETYIARGGPAWPGRLNAMVTPKAMSPDRDSGGRIIDESFAPGLSARQTVAPVARRMSEIRRERRPYGLIASNSNWAVAEGLQGSTGRRIGDRETVGYRAAAPPGAPLPLGRD